MRVVGVTQLDKYAGCMKCTSKIFADRDDPDIGSCAKCNTVQCMDSAKEELVAHVMVRVGGGNLALRVFGKVVEDIAQKPGEQITMASLLKAKAFTMFHKDGIIQSIVRKLK